MLQLAPVAGLSTKLVHPEQRVGGGALEAGEEEELCNHRLGRVLEAEELVQGCLLVLLHSVLVFGLPEHELALWHCLACSHSKRRHRVVKGSSWQAAAVIDQLLCSGPVALSGTACPAGDNTKGS